MKNIIYIICLSFLALTACQKDNEIGGTAVQEMAGEWFVKVNGGGGYYHFSTYNTAENSLSQMWLDDMETFWEFKGKVNVDLNGLSFSGNNIQNTYYNSKFSVIEGKILKNAAKDLPSKTTTDSIYFKVKFSDDDDPETVYTFSGYRRTGFLEDEH